MRKPLFAVALLAGCGAAALVPAAPARAQLKLQIASNDPLTGLPPDQWVDLVTRVIDPTGIVGKDSVYVVNATGESILALNCRGYQLIGPKPYITDNKTTAAPANVPAWKVAIVPTEGFNTYCKEGLDAVGPSKSFHVTVPGGGFQNATFIIVKN